MAGNRDLKFLKINRSDFQTFFHKFYSRFINGERHRTHYHLDKDPPVSRPVLNRESQDDKVIALPRVGGLHRKYVWEKAA